MAGGEEKAKAKAKGKGAAPRGDGGGGAAAEDGGAAAEAARAAAVEGRRLLDVALDLGVRRSTAAVALVCALGALAAARLPPR